MQPGPSSKSLMPAASHPHAPVGPGHALPAPSTWISVCLRRSRGSLSGGRLAGARGLQTGDDRVVEQPVGAQAGIVARCRSGSPTSMSSRSKSRTFVARCRSAARCPARLQNSSMRGISHLAAKVARRRHLELRRAARHLARPRGRAASPVERLHRRLVQDCRPASVSRIERLVRMNSATPSWSSNSLI